jgi:hypothetical protein
MKYQWFISIRGAPPCLYAQQIEQLPEYCCRIGRLPKLAKRRPLKLIVDRPLKYLTAYQISPT